MAFFVIVFVCICLRSVHGSADVDTVCVDIHKQPSLEHPALFNHTIQMTPSFSTQSVGNGISFLENTISCPHGMVPIPRHRGNTESYLVDDTIRIPSSAGVQTKAENYRGARAIFSVYNPPTVEDQYSAALIRIAGDNTQSEIISAGWMASPSIYGDNKTHFHGGWSVGGQGCIDTVCKGFIQVDPKVHFGLVVPNISTPTTDYALEIMISQDQSTGNWWVRLYGDKGTVLDVGYWPKELFGTLNDGGVLQFGGYVLKSSTVGLSPAMGTGVKGNEYMYRSAYFARVKRVTSNYEFGGLAHAETQDVVTNADCYGVYDFVYTSQYGYIFTYGGPGGKCGP